MFLFYDCGRKEYHPQTHIEYLDLGTQQVKQSQNCKILWIYSLPSNSHHQDVRILAGNPYEPLFATVTGYVEGIL